MQRAPHPAGPFAAVLNFIIIWSLILCLEVKSEGKIEYTQWLGALAHMLSYPFSATCLPPLDMFSATCFPDSLAPLNSSSVPYPCHPLTEGPWVQVQRGSELGMCDLPSLRWGMVAAILDWAGICTRGDGLCLGGREPLVLP